jgi:hypothetical protein
VSQEEELCPLIFWLPSGRPPKVDGRAAALGSGASPSRSLDGGDPEATAVSAALAVVSAKTGKNAPRPAYVRTVSFPELIEHHPLFAWHPQQV